MKKNTNLCLDVVRDDLRDKHGEYQSGAELMADITKAIFWTGVENDPFGESEDFNMLDVWSMFGETCKLDRYVDYSREYLATAPKSIITACYVVFGQNGNFVSVCGCEPVGKYEGMYEGQYLIIEVRVAKSGKIIAECL